MKEGTTMAEQQREGQQGRGAAPVSVACGANVQENVELAGRTVAEVRQQLQEVLNIPPESRAILAGSNVGEDYHLRAGDRVEFIRESGTKG